MKQLGVFLFPPGWDASPSQGTPRYPNPHTKFSSFHVNTCMERGTVRVKCLAQEHNAISVARTETQTAHSKVKCSDHEATVPPTTSLIIKVLVHKITQH